MNENRDPVYGQIKEPLGFQNFETFVHHRRRVDCDSMSHAPRWMVEGHGWCHGLEHGWRIAAKRPAGRSENHLPDFLPLAGPQALVDGVVFAVYRKYVDLVAFRRGR